MFRIPTIMDADALLDKAFGRAKKIKGRGKTKAINKISTVKDILNNTLQKYVKAFPSFDHLHPFHYELIDIVIGVDNLRKAIGGIDASRKRINRIASYSIKRAKRESNYREIVSSLYGRISSIVYEMNHHLKFLEDARSKMKKLPHIDPLLPTVIIAGYPNVGKSSLLSLLSSAKPEIDSYPFTTKGLVVGHIRKKKNHETIKIQVIEAPGLLDRRDEERNEIERQGIIALRHLPDLIIFVVDATLHCGYPLEQQMNLLEEIRKEFDVDIIVVENKADMGGKTDFMKISCKTGMGIKELKEEIVKRLL